MSRETFMRVSHDSCETFVRVTRDSCANVTQFYFLAIKLLNGLIYVAMVYICIAYLSLCADR